MLEAKNVVKTFDGFRALDEASLTVPKGAVYGLVGPNGAGKSTIIRHFTGVYRPDSGSLTLEGQPIYENTTVKQRVCVIPDDWFYFSQWSIREMARLYKGMYPTFSQERYDKMHEVFPLDDRQMIRRMSKGMQKQAAFWITMSCMPEYLILDEPADGLDPVMRRQVWSLLLGKVLLERSLSDLQDNTVKLQVAFGGEEPELPASLNVLHHERIGRVHTYIVRGNQNDILAQVSALQPILLEAIPLTLEEIFIYEMGGADYAVHDIVL